MKHWKFVSSLLCLAAACGFPRPRDVTSDAEVTSCTANEFIACEASIARTCNTTGDGTTTQECGPAGCNADAKRCNQCAPSADSCSTDPKEIDHCGRDGLPVSHDTCAIACTATPAAHCAYLEPRYLPDVCDVVATMPDFTVANVASLDDNLDNNCTGGVVAQTGGPPICVVRYGSIHIMSLATLTVVGGRALALVADSALTIDGVLDVSASGATNGPGGGAASGDQAQATTGGGGAGFKTNGGAGGSATVDGGGGLGGGAGTDPSLVTVLVGGTRPNNAIFFGTAISGGGGGAATLIACRGAVSVTGMIDAGGGGGKAGTDLTSGGQLDFNSGAGGGTGGNVVLQGLAITVTGQVFANGGGGGAGNSMNDGGGQNGSDGTRSATVAASGGIALGNEGAGGAGGRQGAAPGVGLHPAGFPSTAGGGGGSVGFFQTYTPMSVTPTLTPMAASPIFGANKTLRTR